MRSIITLFLFLLTAIPAALAQFRVEVLPLGGRPFMLSGSNKSDDASMTARLQIGYQGGSSLWEPYFAASISLMELPLHNKELNTLDIAVFNTSFKVGLNGIIKNYEASRSVWSLAGGIGVCMLRPDDATLRMDGRETILGYTTLKNKAWFPEIELGTRWIRYPRADLRWYMGIQLQVETIWLRDNGVRYTTVISGTSYNLNFNNIALWPSVGGIIGYSF